MNFHCSISKIETVCTLFHNVTSPLIANDTVQVKQRIFFRKYLARVSTGFWNSLVMAYFHLNYLIRVILLSRKSVTYKSRRPGRVYENLFWNISQNSKENISIWISLLIKVQTLGLSFIKKRFWHRCFSVNFTRFCCRTPASSCFQTYRISRWQALRNIIVFGILKYYNQLLKNLGESL